MKKKFYFLKRSRKMQMKLKRRLTYFLLISLLVLSSCGKKSVTQETSETEQDITESITTEQTQTTANEATTEEPKEENPIDFKAYWEIDKNVYAYIEIPDTRISYPVLQSDDEQPEDYYLDHNLDGSTGYPGCIYTQRLNSKDFDDYNTILYGHNMKNGEGFRDLHKFSEKDFFDNNKYVYIYTPDELLTYEIFAAYEFSDDHILYAYDFSNEKGYQEYIDMLKNYGTGYFRDVDSLTTDDRIITLSTCTSIDIKRYLVQAKLVDKKGLYLR